MGLVLLRLAGSTTHDFMMIFTLKAEYSNIVCSNVTGDQLSFYKAAHENINFIMSREGAFIP